MAYRSGSENGNFPAGMSKECSLKDYDLIFRSDMYRKEIDKLYFTEMTPDFPLNSSRI